MVNQQTIILRKRAVPKVVNLPNGRCFASKWERISRKKLPLNIRVTRQRTITPRKKNRMIYLNMAAPTFRKIKARRKQERIAAQLGKGLGSNLNKSFKLQIREEINKQRNIIFQTSLNSEYQK